MFGLFDTKVNIYRINDSEDLNPAGTDIGEVNIIPALVEENRKCAFMQGNQFSRDEGPGSRDGGFMFLLIDKKTDIRDADIVKIVKGPEQSSVYWVVNGGPFTPSRSRWHKECRIQPYIGEPPAE